MDLEYSVQHWFLRRQVELLSGLGAEIVERLEAAVREGREAEAVDLVRPLVRVATRMSHLLWPIGSWATDPDIAAAAESLRRELGLEANHPISPAMIVPYTAIAPMSGSDLRRVVDPGRQVLTFGEREYSIEPLISAFREMSARTSSSVDVSALG